MLSALLMLADSGVQVDWGPWHSLICSVGSIGIVIGLLILAGRGPRSNFNDQPPADDNK